MSAAGLLGPNLVIPRLTVNNHKVCLAFLVKITETDLGFAISPCLEELLGNLCVPESGQGLVRLRLVLGVPDRVEQGVHGQPLVRLEMPVSAERVQVIRN